MRERTKCKANDETRCVFQILGPLEAAAGDHGGLAWHDMVMRYRMGLRTSTYMCPA